MKILVTYASHYGSAKRYAEWIAETLHCEARNAKTVICGTLEAYDCIIHGGGLYAGGLNGMKMIRKNEEVLSQKHLILFSCGIADPGKPENVAHIEEGICRALPVSLRESRQFHFRGGINYPKLNWIHRCMMAMLISAMRKKEYDSLGEEHKMMLDTYGKRIDFSDRESIAPLICYVGSLK